MPKKICLLGSAPSSLPLAPHSDPTWQLWGCSPGAAIGIAGKRVDAWFELHKVTTDFPWFQPTDPYWKFLKEFQGPVWMIEPHPEIPNSRRYPIEQMIDKYGPFFWQSSLSYMAALALEDPELEVLGWRGVDMAAVEEYAQQKPACQYMIWEAMKRGIVIDIPPESDLFYPQQMYGYSEVNPHRIKLDVRQKELGQRLFQCQQQMEASQKEYWFIKGACDDNQYHANTYIQHPLAIGKLGQMQDVNARALAERQKAEELEAMRLLSLTNATEGKEVRGPEEGHAEQGNGSHKGNGSAGAGEQGRRRVSGKASGPKPDSVHGADR